VLVSGAEEDLPAPLLRGGGGGLTAGAGVEDELVDVLVLGAVEDGVGWFVFCEELGCCALRESPSSEEVDASVLASSEKTQ
jgi:hypothetical protein